MRWSALRSRKFYAVGCATAAVVVVAGGIAHATAVPGQFTGCLKGGTLTNVAFNSDTPSARCTGSATKVHWNQTGPAGPQGSQGPQGPAGPQGPPGTVDQSVLDQINTLQTEVDRLSALLNGVTATDNTWQVKKGNSVLRVDAYGTTQLVGAGTSVSIEASVGALGIKSIGPASIKAPLTKLGSGSSCSSAASQGSLVQVDPATGTGSVLLGHPLILLCD